MANARGGSGNGSRSNRQPEDEPTDVDGTASAKAPVEESGGGTRRTTRRRYLRAVGALGIAGVAGCSGSEGSDGASGTTHGGDDGSDATADGDSDATAADGSDATAADATPTESASGDASSDALTPWMVPHANLQRTRSTPDRVPQEFTELAAVPGGKFATDGTGPAPLVTGDGVFLLGNEAIGGFNVSNLKKKYVRELGGRDRFSDLVPGYVTGDTIVTQFGGSFLGLAVSDGKRNWIVEGEGVPFATGDGIGFVRGGEIGIMEAETRDVRWKKSREALNTRPPAVHTDSGTLFVQSKSDVLALDVATGEQQWTLSRKKPTPLTVHGDAVYVLDEDGLLAVDRASGSVRWKQLDKGIMKLQIGGGGGPPKYAVDEGGFYAESLNEKVVALDRSDGTELWSTPFTANRIGSLVAGGDGLVYRTNSGGVRVLSKANGDSQGSTNLFQFGGISLAGGRIYGWKEDVPKNQVVAVGSE